MKTTKPSMHRAGPGLRITTSKHNICCGSPPSRDQIQS